MDTKTPTASLVETFQKQILGGITMVNEKLFTLSYPRRKKYLSVLLPALHSRIKEVDSYIEKLSAPDRADELAAMRVVQQDLLRTILFVQKLLDEYDQQRVLLKFREQPTTKQIPTIPSPTINSEELDTRNPFSTSLKLGEPPSLLPKMEGLEFETNPKGPVKKSMLRQPREKFPEPSVPVHKEGDEGCKE
ncbi:uncharacterized protein EAF01_002920 [Botrytis porri]|uniref:Uncharacterized protein n=1 Tax=Botrytis porri TaxID=87229 RepID=A0A4Z1KKH7_9HELO|nr:uncharacterized protein EAF01_002920 [Botrytis porri]KAF7911413.1 hypothetical protein EAF01_002920 [Botrytis porri]TGO81959.1 hypothetical protein BPOR_0961g00030 [Botrytis porri]